MAESYTAIMVAFYGMEHGMLNTTTKNKYKKQIIFKMKIVDVNKLARSALSIVLVLGITASLQSCASKMLFSNSSVVPGAEGSVKVKKDKNNNYSIDLTVMHLADPKRLDPPKDIYIVWMETGETGTKNIGQLKTSSSLLSNTLKSSLRTVTTAKPTGFFITAEDKADIQYPAGQVVLRTASF